MRISIIGAGRLGKTLALALHRSGYSIVDLCNRSGASARAARRFVGAGRAICKLADLSPNFELLWLVVPDAQIEPVAGRLSRLPLIWKGKQVWHASGALGSESLGALKRAGARVASVHPLQTFPRPTTPAIFENTFFGLEGEPRWARQVVRRLGGIPLPLDPADKPLYHALATLVCGLAGSLYLEAIETFKSEIGNPKALVPLMRKTFDNLMADPNHNSLSGPFVRGDRATIARHLKALSRFPKLRQVYLDLGKLAQAQLAD